MQFPEEVSGKVEIHNHDKIKEWAGKARNPTEQRQIRNLETSKKYLNSEKTYSKTKKVIL